MILKNQKSSSYFGSNNENVHIRPVCVFDSYNSGLYGPSGIKNHLPELRGRYGLNQGIARKGHV
jgi:hypothetical protein